MEHRIFRPTVRGVQRAMAPLAVWERHDAALRAEGMTREDVRNRAKTASALIGRIAADAQDDLIRVARATFDLPSIEDDPDRGATSNQVMRLLGQFYAWESDLRRRTRRIGEMTACWHLSLADVLGLREFFDLEDLSDGEVIYGLWLHRRRAMFLSAVATQRAVRAADPLATPDPALADAIAETPEEVDRILKVWEADRATVEEAMRSAH